MNYQDITVLNLMLGGIPPKIIDKNYYWCGVDSGANYLIDNDINPLEIYGDFDSILNNKNYSEYRLFKKDSQDLTDSEFALIKIIDNFPNIKEINIYGATGKRLDHFFGNVMMISNERFKDVKLKIIDDYNYIYLSNIGENEVEPKKNFKYISFVPIYEGTIISIENAKYSVENILLDLNRANATSNEFLNDNSITFITNKECLIIYSID